MPCDPCGCPVKNLLSTVHDTMYIVVIVLTNSTTNTSTTTVEASTTDYMKIYDYKTTLYVYLAPTLEQQLVVSLVTSQSLQW